jgi:hypothetical protein
VVFVRLLDATKSRTKSFTGSLGFSAISFINAVGVEAEADSASTAFLTNGPGFASIVYAAERAYT